MSRLRAEGVSHFTFPIAHSPSHIGWLVRQLACMSDGGYCALGVAHAGARSIGLDGAVTDGDDAVGVVGDVGLMGNQDNGVALGVELVEEGHDFYRGLG